jgi:hypothetical protein
MMSRAIRKTLFTLNVDGFSQDIIDITYPYLKRYAKKIGAEFVEITERQFPGWPVVYEKLQIHRLAQEMGNDWNIYLDADALVHPETVDWTLFLKKDTIAHNGSDMANIRWRYDEFFMRDGRNIGSCNWCTIASDWCIDLWRPLDIPMGEALDNIQPSVGELNTIITREHLIDDYALSRNIARFGLKFTTLMRLQEEIGLKDADFYFHLYTIPTDEKIKRLKETLTRWKLK